MQRKERSSFDEREFLDFARSYLSEAFPNPERTGCPPDDALRSLAFRPMHNDEPISEHLACCSPCFTAYMTHLARAKAEAIDCHEISRVVWIRRSASAFAVAAILVVAAYVFITKRRPESIIAPRMPAPISVPGNSQTATYVPVVIDLSNVSPTRGTEQGTAHRAAQIIPSGSPVDLSLRLPLGSEERLYSITLKSSRNIVWSESAQARWENGEMLLRVRADFSHIPAGKYDLQVASARRRLSVPVLIRALHRTTEQKP